MKNEGVTILQIVITVIVMLIITTIAVLYGQGVSKEANIASIYNEIKEIETSLKEAHLLNGLVEDGENINIYDEITVSKVDPTNYNKVLGGSTSVNYYYLDFTSSRKLANVLDIENIKNDYILDLDNLNIYLIKGLDIPEVINDDGVEKKENIIKYNSDEIVDYYTNVFVK